MAVAHLAFWQDVTIIQVQRLNSLVANEIQRGFRLCRLVRRHT
jgi:hypothetical protein